MTVILILRKYFKLLQAVAATAGLSSGQVADITGGIYNDADKIRAVFDKKIDAAGENAAVAALLEACRRIPHPIIGGVMDILSK